MDKSAQNFLRFVEIVAQLRDPQAGCPWDIKQTHESLIPYLIEESYEVAEALKDSSDAELIEELGDLLLQIVLHSQIAKEEQRFSIEQVLLEASEKLIRRHPHVFGDLKLNGVDAVLENWEKIKAQEGKTKDKIGGLLAGVPKALPALLKADRMGAKAARIGLDWPNSMEVLEKIQEELAEFVATQSSDSQRVNAEEEFGDLLFSLAQYARKCGLNAEECLQSACSKFAKRVAYVENNIATAGQEISPEELDILWQKAKLAKNS
jgi:MazG family protein